MIIYMAGNTPDREREEKVLIKKGLFKRRLFSYHYLKQGGQYIKMFRLWKYI